VQLLVERGVDAFVKDKDGHTAYDYATRLGHQKVAHLLSLQEDSVTPLVRHARAVVGLTRPRDTVILEQDKTDDVLKAESDGSSGERGNHMQFLHLEDEITPLDFVAVLKSVAESEDVFGFNDEDDSNEKESGAHVSGGDASGNRVTDGKAQRNGDDEKNKRKVKYKPKGKDRHAIIEGEESGQDLKVSGVTSSFPSPRKDSWDEKFYSACKAGDAEAVRELLAREYGEVNIEDPENNHYTGLHLASAGGHIHVVQLLVEKGAYLDARTVTGMTPLLLAAEQCR